MMLIQRVFFYLTPFILILIDFSLAQVYIFLLVRHFISRCRIIISLKALHKL